MPSAATVRPARTWPRCSARAAGSRRSSRARRSTSSASAAPSCSSGARNRMLPHTDARIALGSLPTTQVELIEGAGRRPQLEATGRLLELLLPFGT
jgi:hypothetical protein